MVKSAMASPNSDTAQIGTDSFKYKGVRKRKWGKWVSEIRLPNSRDRIWLGSYDSPEKAARAFDAALFYLRGRHANFNFPDTPLQIHVAADHHDHQSPTPQEIQVLAARFANHHHQHQVPPHEDFSERGASLHPDRVTLTETASTSCTSSSSMYNDIDCTLQLDHEDTIDWSFLNLLDANEVGSDYALYSGLHNVHSGDFELYPTPPVTFELNAEDNESDDAISLLWNFGCEWL